MFEVDGVDSFESVRADSFDACGNYDDFVLAVAERAGFDTTGTVLDSEDLLAVIEVIEWSYESRSGVENAVFDLPEFVAFRDNDFGVGVN